MIVSICEAISRTTDNGLQLNTAYYLFVRAATTGEISVYSSSEWGEIIYGNIHDFLKDWQNITCHGYANNEEDVRSLFDEIRNR